MRWIQGIVRSLCFYQILQCVRNLFQLTWNVHVMPCVKSCFTHFTHICIQLYIPFHRVLYIYSNSFTHFFIESCTYLHRVLHISSEPVCAITYPTPVRIYLCISDFLEILKHSLQVFKKVGDKYVLSLETLFL